MTGVDLDPIVFLGGGGATLFIVLLVARVQRDFIARYSERNRELEERIDALEGRHDQAMAEADRRYRDLLSAVRRCERREAILRRVLAGAGIDLPPDYPFDTNLT